MAHLLMSKACLEVTNDRAELTRCQKPRPERARPVLADGWKGLQGGADVCRQLSELPTDLVCGGLWPVRGRQAGGSDRIRGSA